MVGRDKADFCNPDICVDFVAKTDADAIINAVAYTKVDQAEEQEEAALLINGTAPGAIAQAAAAREFPLAHISSDYVFNGTGKAPFNTDHSTAPLGAYGRTKLIGEKAVREAQGPYVILRTSWIFSPHGQNFVKTMLRLGSERDELSIVNDQIGGPTSASSIADACLSIAGQLVASPQKSGTYHFSGTPDASWADFAREIFAQSGMDCQIREILSSEFPTPTSRPLNSRLNNSSTKSVFGLSRPDWRRDLQDTLRKLKAHSA